jgi:hypothetical protein
MKILEGHVIENLPVRQAGDELIPIDFNWSNDNLLINGNFDIWQRGASQDAPFYGSADRWWSTVGYGGSIGSLSRQAFSTGQTDVPNNPTSFSRTIIANVGIDIPAFMSQAIEDVRTVAGKTVTLSFWARTDSEKNMQILLQQRFGSGGSASISNFSSPIVINDVWTKCTFTSEFPPIVDKIIGSDSRVTVFIYFSHPNTDVGLQIGIFDIAQVKLEFGDRATPFVPRHIAEELLLCQRYFQRKNTNNINPLDLRPTMRVNPTIIFNPWFGGWGYDAELH